MVSKSKRRWIKWYSLHKEEYLKKSRKRKCSPQGRKKSRDCKRKYLESHPWYKTYRAAKWRCRAVSKYKGIKMLMSVKDFKYLWFRDKAYKMDVPSIDRKDSKGNYILSNCRYLELSENSRRVVHRR